MLKGSCFFAKKELAKPAGAAARVLGPEISTKQASLWLATAALNAAGRIDRQNSFPCH